MPNIAIVTGASSGLGLEYVRQLEAGNGGPLDEIWAIARSRGRLEELAEAQTHVPVRPLALDLSEDESFERLKGLLAAENPCVLWLINCAGFGTFGTFADIGDKNTSLVRLNCLGLVSAISSVLPYMTRGSRIINISSIAALIPQVELAAYSASKAFVLELSRMLDHELKREDIRVLAVCPRFMKTRFLDDAGDAKVIGRMVSIGYDEVDEVVSKSLRYAVLGIGVFIPAHGMRAAAFAAKHLPRWLLFALEDVLFGHWYQ